MLTKKDIFVDPKFDWCLCSSNNTSSVFLIEFGSRRYGIFLRYYVDLASLKEIA